MKKKFDERYVKDLLDLEAELERPLSDYGIWSIGSGKMRDMEEEKVKIGG